MSPRRELFCFAAVLGTLVGAFFGESLFAGRILSPADVLLVSASFRDDRGPLYEPANRLLMDPVLQFQPWLEFNRAMVRQGRLPLWNSYAGCGTPHLANAQSAVFDPFSMIAYVGRLPDALGWMAAARLWVAGFGMFLLARSWGLGRWGRWFAGLTFPFCGFVVAWLLYPVTNVAIWMPWLLWSSETVLRQPGRRSAATLAVFTFLVIAGGHIQTSAHVLLAAALYVGWRLWERSGAARRLTAQSASGPIYGDPRGSRVAVRLDSGETRFRRSAVTWAGGVALGVALAAVVIVPLAVELTKSPVWSDRAQERPSPWRLTRPRILEAACTALPYLYGSQRRDQPHLGHAVGVHNLNESAGGFAGLATLIWLAPLALSARREIPFVGYLAGLTTIGALAAFGIPPVANLLRVLPVLDVTDNRRLTLWVAFGLVLLGGIGLDRLADDRARHPRTILWAIGAILLATTAFGVTQLGPRLRERARTHYANAASRNPAADPRVYQARADAQTAKTLAFVPRYYAAAAGQLLLLAGLAEALRRRMLARAFVRPAIVGVVMLDLFAFGYGLNPAIARADDRPISPVVAYLQREVGERGRVLGLSEELPPNVAMRYGLKDIRNYDSVEIARSLAWFAPVYSQGARARTSRREITWEGVVRARERLRQASVCAVVSATPPPPGAFERVDKVGNAWIARLDGMPWASSQNGGKSIYCDQRNGYIESNVSLAQDDRILLRETYDPGWRATIDGVPVGVEPYLSTFLAVRVPSGMHRLQLHYDPPEVRLALAISGFALVLAVFALTDSRPFRSTRIIFRRLGRIRAIELESV